MKREAIGGSKNGSKGAQRKVVVSADSATSRMYLSLLFKRMGFEVVQAPLGLRTVTESKRVMPSLVLLSFGMETDEGLATLKHLRNSIMLSSVPVIVVASGEEAHLQGECKRLGCRAYFIKPVSLDDLHRAVNEWVAYDTGRRRHIRASYKKTVILIHGGKRDRTRAVNLSEGGIYLKSEMLLPVGTPVTVALPPSNGQGCELPGAVIYAKDGEEEEEVVPGFAVQFKRLEPKTSFNLRHIIRTSFAKEIKTGSPQSPVSLDD